MSRGIAETPRAAHRLRPPFRLELLPVVVLLLLPVVFPVAPAVAAAPAREGWAFGAGLGPGLGGEGDGVATGVGASLRVLYTFNRWVGMGVESNVWAPNLTVGNYRTSVMTAAIHCFPFGGPFSLRLGAGLGRHERRFFTDPFAPTSPLRTYSYSGFGATAGAGLEFKLGSHLGVGPQLDISIADADGFNGYANATLQLNWYRSARP